MYLYSAPSPLYIYLIEEKHAYNLQDNTGIFQVNLLVRG